jgi:hypothetical protein
MDLLLVDGVTATIQVHLSFNNIGSSVTEIKKKTLAIDWNMTDTYIRHNTNTDIDNNNNLKISHNST